MMNVNESNNPYELEFERRYGNISTYHWFGDGYMVVGFSEGYMVLISTHMKEIGAEIFSTRVFNAPLDDICICEKAGKLAAKGDDMIKIFSTNTWTELKTERIVIPPNAGKSIRMNWTSDGQIITLSTAGGFVYN